MTTERFADDESKPEANAASPASSEPQGPPRFKPIDRQQMTWTALDIDQLVPAEHVVRAIWELTGRLDWSRFTAHIKAVEGVAGAAAYDPRLLASLWILAYSQRIHSAREIERRCQHDPAYRWLTGLAVVNYHTLSDFRVDHKAELDELFAQILAVLQGEGMIRLERVTQDGTKIAAAASSASMHRQAKLQQHLAEARQRVAEMENPQPPGEEETSAQQREAQQRAAQEQLERMEQSLKELEKVRAEAEQSKKQKEPAECRVSESEPEARKMKHPLTGAFTPSYNAQIVTDAAEGVIVGTRLIQAANDQGQLAAGLEEVERNTGKVPQQVVADEGYLSRGTVMDMAARGIDLIGGGQFDEEGKTTPGQQKQLHNRGVQPEFYPSVFVYDATRDLYLCPRGQELPHRGVKHDREGVERHQYRACGRQCRCCSEQPHCCPVKPGKRVAGRMIIRAQNVPVVQAYVDKMKRPEAQAIYKDRKRVAEFPHLWIKEKLGLRRFHVRGMVKAGCELLWACLTYDIQQWVRLRWLPLRAVGVAAA